MPKKIVEKIPASPPVRVDIRVNGRVKFAGDVYEPALDTQEGMVTFTADLQPAMIERPAAVAPTRFRDQNDPRDGEKIINRIHSGRRDIPVEIQDEPEPA